MFSLDRKRKRMKKKAVESVISFSLVLCLTIGLLAPMSVSAQSTNDEDASKVKNTTVKEIKKAKVTKEGGTDSIDIEVNTSKVEAMTQIEALTIKPEKGVDYDGYVVRMKDKAINELESDDIEEYAPTVGERFLFVDNPKDALDFAKPEEIEYIEPNYELETLAFPTDPPNDEWYDIGHGGNSQWDIKKINAHAAWKRGYNGNGVSVGVFDSGIKKDHGDFKSDTVEFYGNFCGYPNNWSTVASDDNGHGTGVSSIIAANTNNTYGMASVAYNSKISMFDVTSPTESYLKDLITAAEYAHNSSTISIDVASMSLVSSKYNNSLKEAIDTLSGDGTIVVAGNGNDGVSGSPLKYPAYLPNVIGVGSTDKNDNVSDFSCKNIALDVTAPGEYIIMAALGAFENDQDFTISEGTSYSTPMVAGAAAYAKQKFPSITVDQFRTLLAETSTDKGTSGYDINYGNGILNLDAFTSKLDSISDVNSIEKTFKITYVYDQGTINQSTVTRQYKTSGNPVALPTATGGNSAFEGWCENSNLTGTPITSLPAGTTGDKVLFAKYAVTNVVDLSQHQNTFITIKKSGGKSVAMTHTNTLVAEGDSEDNLVITNTNSSPVVIEGDDNSSSTENDFNITLSDANLNNSGGIVSGATMGLLIQKCANVNVTLEGTNTCTGTGDFSGITVVGAGTLAGASKISINGTGTLNATGVNYSGIGNSATTLIAGLVTINGGTINASSTNGTGIGASGAGQSYGVNILGGYVTASGATDIGVAGTQADVVKIVGGSVYAKNNIINPQPHNGQYYVQKVTVPAVSNNNTLTGGKLITVLTTPYTAKTVTNLTTNNEHGSGFSAAAVIYLRTGTYTNAINVGDFEEGSASVVASPTGTQNIVSFAYKAFLAYQDGSGSPNNIDITNNTYYYQSALATITPTHATKSFDGWYTAETGGSKINLDSGNNPTMINVTKSVYLYARYSPITYSVTFDSQSGSTPSSASKTVTCGEEYGTLPTTTRSGYDFGGWYTAPDGGGTLVTASTIVSSKVAHTLFAKWNSNLPVDNILTYELISGNNVRVTGLVNANTTAVTIPAITNFNGTNCNVVEVTHSAFLNSNLQQVNFSEDLAAGFKIGNNAFKGSVSLDSVTLPKANYSIQNDAFNGCTSLKTVDISKATSLGTNAFAGCTSLSAIGVSTNKISIEANSFANVNSLILVTNGTGPPDASYSNLTGFPAGTTFPAISGLNVTTDGSIFSLGVTPRDDNLLTYQWKKDDNNILNATAGAFTKVAQLSDAGDYTCEVTLGNLKYTPVEKSLTVNQLTSYLISFNSNRGGQPSFDSKRVTVGSIYGDLPVATRSGYTFKGWYTTSRGGTEIKSDTVVQANDPDVLYAHWNSTRPVDGVLTYESAGVDKVRVTGLVNSNTTAITIPAVTNFNGEDCEVVGIKDSAFYNDGLEKVNFSQDIQPGFSIGTFAFELCDSLNIITMPSINYSMGDNAFHGCSSLEEINLEGATNISSQSFVNCTSLSSINMPTSKYSIGYEAFYSCSSLKSVDLTNATSINASFTNCTSLVNLTMPSINYILSGESFYNCVSLEEIDLSKATLSGLSTFSGCQSLKTVTMPSVNYILKDSFFKGCASLEVIDLSKATAIDNSTFTNCTSLKAIGVSTTKPSIVSTAFEGVGSLILIADGNGPPNATYSNMTGFPAGTTFPAITGATTTTTGSIFSFGLTASDDSLLTYQWTKDNTNIAGATGSAFTKVAQLTDAGDYTCKVSLGNLTYTPMKKSLTVNQSPSYIVTFNTNGGGQPSFDSKRVTIGSIYGDLPVATRSGYSHEGWFTAAQGGTKITKGSIVKASDPDTLYAHWNSTIPVDGVLTYESAGVNKVRVTGLVNSNTTAITIPAVTNFNGTNCEVVGIKANAFYGDGLEKVNFSQDIQPGFSIDSYAFSHCYSLNTITMPSISYSLGGYTFYSCSSLEEVNLKDATDISTASFSKCTSLSSINMPTSKYSIGYEAFYGCNSLESLDLTNAISINASFKHCTSLVNLTMPSINYSLGGESFYNCASLEEMDLSKATLSGQSAFSGCQSLKTVTMPSVNYALNFNYFTRCSSLEVIDLSKATTIERFTFADCTSLKAIGVSTTKPSIANNSFEGVGSLILITDGDGPPNATYSNMTGFPTGTTFPAISGPGITTQGSIFSLGLTAKNDNILKYQWTKDNVNINGATGNALTKVAQLTDAGDYTCKVNLGNLTYTPMKKSLTVNPNIFNVDFNLNGGDTVAYDSKSVTYGAAYGNLPIATKAGYTFDGWFTEETGGIPISETTIYNLTTDQALYAHWTANTYTVTFDKNGGDTVSTATKSALFDDTYGTLATASKAGYTFSGWYTSTAYTTEITSGSIVNITNDHKLYAKWTPNKYTVTFDKNNGDSTAPPTKVVTYDEEYGTLANAIRDGYTFEGWYTSEAGGYEIDATDIVKITSNTTLYARWSANDYAITFDSNGGSAPNPSTMQVTYDDKYGPLPTSAKEGYTFLGWYPSTSSRTEIKEGGTVEITQDTTLYARWIANDYTLSFDKNGGDEVSKSSKKVTYDYAHGTLPTATRAGYSFIGWHTDALGGTEIKSTDIVKYTADTTLYAKWSANDFSVTLDVNGGDKLTNNTKTVTRDGTYGDFPTPTKKGHAFQGWFTEKIGGTRITADSKVEINDDQTLYAQWKVKAYTVTFKANAKKVKKLKPKSKKVTYNAKLGKLPKPKKKGYIFKGWYTKKKGGTKLTKNSIMTYDKNIILYAKWKKNGKIVKCKVAKLRKGPGNDYAIKGYAKKGKKICILKKIKKSRTNVWYKVKVGKKVGYIYKKYVKKLKK